MLQKLRKAGGRAGRFRVRFVFQAANSPDMNHCDLGLFSMLWSAVNKVKKCGMMTTDQLWETVQQAFWAIPGYKFEILYRIQVR